MNPNPEITTAVIAALAAILAALGAQVVGGLVTARREKQHSRFEQEKWKEQREQWNAEQVEARQRWDAEQSVARQRWEAEQAVAQRLRHLEDRKLIVEDLLAGIASLTEYQNDHFPNGVPDRSVNKTALLDLYRNLTRANRRGRVYFSPETIELIAEELYYWKSRIDLLDRSEQEQRLTGFRLMVHRSKSGRQEVLQTALQREVWST